MKNTFFDKKMIVIYLLIFTVVITLSLTGNQLVSVFSENRNVCNTVIIDAGHGGVDGGAVSCTGMYESQINLEIALKLEDLMHFLGMRTVMIRNTDRSVYTEGETIAAKKVSDIRNRVHTVNTAENGILVSIHQNNFTDKRYSGSQVFYNKFGGSKPLADEIQRAFRESINPFNKRQTKKASGIYLMEHINCPGILIECGFLSNEAEEQLLRENGYQQKLCCVIACTVSRYLNT